MARALCLASFEIPEWESITNGAAVEALISQFSAKGRSCKDHLINTETKRLVDQVKSLNEISVLLPLLESQRLRGTEILNAEFASVRVFCWSIPVVGLIGTTLALGQAVSGFSAFLALGDHAPEDIRKAVTIAESSLAAASEPLILAILLTAVISALWSMIAHKQKAVLGLLEDVCQAFVIALSRWQAGPLRPNERMSEPQRDFASAGSAIDSPDVATIKATLHSVRSEISELAPAVRRLSETLRRSAQDAPRTQSASAGD